MLPLTICSCGVPSGPRAGKGLRQAPPASPDHAHAIRSGQVVVHYLGECRPGSAHDPQLELASRALGLHRSKYAIFGTPPRALTGEPHEATMAAISSGVCQFAD